MQIGGATVNTTGGALNTHDRAVEAAIKLMHSELSALMALQTSGATVHVHSSGGVAHVADAFSRTLGTGVRSRLRSAGVRGT